VLVELVTFSVALPLIPPSEAVTLVDPTECPIAKPLEFTVATLAFPAVQLAVEVTFPVDPSE
jgi:hypothetical protein